MRINFNGINVTPIDVTVSEVLPFNRDRTYLAVIATAPTTILFTDDSVSFDIAAGQVYAPQPAPINAITITGTATVITG